MVHNQVLSVIETETSTNPNIPELVENKVNALLLPEMVENQVNDLLNASKIKQESEPPTDHVVHELLHQRIDDIQATTEALNQKIKGKTSNLSLSTYFLIHSHDCYVVET